MSGSVLTAALLVYTPVPLPAAFAPSDIAAFAAAARSHQVRADWDRVYQNARTMSVQVDRKTVDRTFQASTHSREIYRLLRRADGTVLMSFEAHAPGGDRQTWIVRGKTMLFLDHGRKAVIQAELNRQRLWFAPGVSDALQIIFAIVQFDFDYDGEPGSRHTSGWGVYFDGTYTYLTVPPRRTANSLTGGIRTRLTVMNEPGKAIPRNLPRQVWYGGGPDGNEVFLDVVEWRIDAGDVSERDFAPPPGWETVGIDSPAR